MALSLSTAPAVEPLTIAEAKDSGRITHNREDGLVNAWITEARCAFETFALRAVITQTWVYWVRGFSDVIPLPMAAPLQNDSEADPSTAPIVEYYDADGVLTTLDASYYLVNTASEPGQIERAPETTWPTVQCHRQWPVRITYVAGWTRETVPELVKQGMRTYVAVKDADRLGVADPLKAAAPMWAPFQLYPFGPRC